MVVDSDELARDAVAPGTAGLARIRDRWGPEMLQNDGSLDRAALRDVVFRDRAERKALESIVHPEVHRLRVERFAAALGAGERIAVADIPLLFETGLEDDFDVVVLVDATEQERLRRLTVDRGLQEDEAMRMIAAQMPSAQKRAQADYVINNDGTIETLQTRAAGVWEALQERAGRMTGE